MATSSASGLRDSSSLASASIGSDSDMAASRLIGHLSSWTGPRCLSSGPGRCDGLVTGRICAAELRLLAGSYRNDGRCGLVGSSGQSRTARSGRKKESGMSPHMKFGIAGVIIGLILFIVSPWLALGVIVASIAIPTAMYLMLDPSQRRRLRQSRSRKQLGG